MRSKSHENFNVNRDAITKESFKRLGGLVGEPQMNAETQNALDFDQAVATPVQKVFSLDIEPGSNGCAKPDLETPITSRTNGFVDVIYSNVKSLAASKPTELETPNTGANEDHRTPVTLRLDPEHEYRTPEAKSTTAVKATDTFQTQVKTFEYSLIKNIVAEVVEEQTQALVEDVENMHLEMIRQFEIQKV